MKNLIKKALLLSLSGVLALGFTGCGGQNTSNVNNKTETSGESTLDKNVWIVGLDDSFAPMGFRDEKGEIVGFDVDLAKAFGEKLGKEIKLQPIDWSMKETELSSGNIDFIWNGYTITDERKEKVSFSIPYLNNKQVIVTLADSAIKTKADLADKNVGAQNQSSAVTAMEKEADLYNSFKGGKAVTFEDNNQALMDLEAGRIDAVVADEILLRYYIALKGEEKFAVLEENFGDEEYGVGMRKDDQKMVDAFNAAYGELKADGTLAAISEKWFAEDITN
ncbi:amino acid ABC transporter substrate-binding protein [Cellulosilyticum sp. I15G10I2]|uniref:amino acid ABC transporter substrate-binding protein n=1 Tax=Cellulosilyticum sp. I15G10I2 TaxID=1892843 RepID=UPI00085CC2E0|nr:amino acid ABC transporter substrate-binding protein [Cellulosilyticum sp. I15G10I2]